MTDKESIEVDLWAERAAESAKEAEGVDFVWKGGWTFRVTIMSEWNQKQAESARILGRRNDAKAFFKRTDVEGYVMSSNDREFLRTLEIEAFCRGNMLGWSNVIGADKKPLVYTPTAAVKLFKHFPNLFVELRAFAATKSNFSADMEDSADPLAV